jgi:chemotaxis protein MotB
MGEKNKRSRIHLDNETHEHVHDESNWLVSYADLMTLLFGFFVLMYSLTKFDGTKFDLVRKEVAKYFGGSIKDVSAVIMAEQKIINVMKGSGDLNGVEIVRDGENTILLKFDGQVLFDSGATEIKEESKPNLRRVVGALRAIEGIAKVAVEGHTDSESIQSGIIKSNWELSALRAGSVVRYLEESGLDGKLLSVVGFGSAKPLVPEKDQNGTSIPQNQIQNRRVVIAVTMDDAEAAYKLRQKQFSKQLTKDEIDQQKKLETLQDKMKSAQARFDEAQKRHREQMDQRRRQQQLEKLEKKIHDLESKAQRYEESATPKANQ